MQFSPNTLQDFRRSFSNNAGNCFATRNEECSQASCASASIWPNYRARGTSSLQKAIWLPPWRKQSGVSLGNARCLGSLAPCPVQKTLAHCSTASAGVSHGMEGADSPGGEFLLPKSGTRCQEPAQEGPSTKPQPTAATVSSAFVGRCFSDTHPFHYFKEEILHCSCS